MTRAVAVAGSRDVAGRVHNPGGVTQIGRDLDTVNAASWAPTRQPGVNTVVVHGTPEGWSAGLSTDDVAGAVASHPDYVPGSPTCLFSCHAGGNGTGQQLADALDGLVVAPNGPVTVFPPGLGCPEDSVATEAFDQPGGLLQYELIDLIDPKNFGVGRPFR